MEKVHFKFTSRTPEMFADVIFDEYNNYCGKRGRDLLDDGRVKDICYRVGRWYTITSTRPWLFLIGGIGTGKTSLMRSMMAAARALNPTRGVINLNDPKSYRYTAISALDLPKYATDERYQDKYTNIVSGLESGSVPGGYLYLDDAGQEPIEFKSYGNSIAPFVEIINKRYELLLPMVVTSNLSMAAFKERYGDRVADRIKEMAEIITFTWDSYR